MDVVLEGDRDAKKGAEFLCAFAVALAGKNGFGANSLLERLFFTDGQVGIETGIQSGDAIEKETREFNRRELSSSIAPANFGNRGEGELSIGRHQNIFSW
jgi:hypothetical protein